MMRYIKDKLNNSKILKEHMKGTVGNNTYENHDRSVHTITYQ